MKLRMTIDAKTGRLIEVSEIHMRVVRAPLSGNQLRVARTRDPSLSWRRASATTTSPAARPRDNLHPLCRH